MWSAEFHHVRLPNPDLWRDQLEKLKASGFNAVSLYFSWAYHSPAPGVFDFSGVRDVDRLLDIAQEVGLYVIARPGPYINAELDSRRLPGWLTTQAGSARTNADDYQAAWEQWFSAVNRIIARHQFTDGRGPVILYQIENEYDGSDAAYMEELKAAARRDGITVPLFHNDKGRNLLWSAGPGAPEIYATDTYPAGFDCNRTSFPGVTDYRFLRDGTSFNPPRPGVGDRPFFFAEFQGGAFDPWGGPGYDRCRALTGPAFERMFYANNIENQFTAQNLYMAYGGTNWGWQADPNVVYTSYDYGAAFSETRRLTEKVPVLKQLGYIVNTVTDLRRPMISARWPAPPTRRCACGSRRIPTRGRGSTSSATPATGRPPPTTRRASPSMCPTVCTPRRCRGQRPGLQDPARRLRPRAPAAGLLDLGDLHPHARGRPRRRAAARPPRGGGGDRAALREQAAGEGAWPATSTRRSIPPVAICG